LARQKVAIDQLRKEAGPGRSLMINCGNLTKTTTKADFESKYKTLEVALKGYDMMRAEIFTPGVQELIYGREMINSLHKFAGESAIVCSNLDYRAPGIQASRIVTVARKKILVASVFDPKLEKKAFHGLKAMDPAAALKKALSQPHDLAIVVFHFSDNRARQLIRQIDGIDIAILATQRGIFREFEKINGCIVVKNNNHGKTVGSLDWDFTKMQPLKLRMVKIDKQSFASDPEIAKLVDKHEKWLRNHYIELEKQKESEAGNEEEDTDYVGTQLCGRCHPQITASWKATRHARAYASLQKKCKDYCPDCLPCHVTGSRAHDKKGFSSPAKTPFLFNVQCEECHGPAEQHIRNPKANYGWAITEKTCTTCHNENTDPEFSFSHDRDLISHETGDKEKELGGQSEKTGVER